MQAKREIGLCLVASVLLATMLGCPTTSTELPVSITAPLKLAQGLIGDLTVEEWLFLAEAGSSIPGLPPLPPLTEAQAQAIVTFLDDNGIVTLTDLQTKMTAGTLVIPQDLISVFLGTNSGS
ncbi:MAG: hypothetical protein KA354_16300 [Phycisphaerae bacterium]|nr:hypothetical protein [Phycisphaerae bacterium]